MLLVYPGDTVGHFLLYMGVPSAVFGSLLAYLWGSLGFFWEAVGHILHTLAHFGVTWMHFGRSLGFPLAARSLPEGVEEAKRYPKVVENR